MSTAKHTFFCKDLNFGILDEIESHHASRVMRMSEKDEINIVDGKGRRVLAEITSIGKNEVGFEILKEEDNDSHPLLLHIAIAPTKNIDRFTFFLEKVAEMGIKEVTPIISSNSERKILKIDKLKRGMISALKQSGNLFLPLLHEPKTLKDFLSKDFGDVQKSIAHCEADGEKVSLHEIAQKHKTHLILIGPEGDFTPEEVILAKEKGFEPISLGEARFRTETAGILACHTVFLYS